MRRPRRRQSGEAGYTLIEMLIASAMGVVLLGAVGSMLISSMRSQPKTTEKAQNISSARWVMERLTREIRNGVAVETALANEVSFRTFVRRTTCGGTAVPPSTTPSIECRVTYSCTTTSCTRQETAPDVGSGGTPIKIFDGIDDSSVFSYSPIPPATPTFIGVTLHFPNPEGPADLTISDGASLRNATLEG
jgi:prepilin-type N-terminal cleavage/methylation domain-containing protein